MKHDKQCCTYIHIYISLVRFQLFDILASANIVIVLMTFRDLLTCIHTYIHILLHIELAAIASRSTYTINRWCNRFLLFSSSFAHCLPSEKNAIELLNVSILYRLARKLPM